MRLFSIMMLVSMVTFGCSRSDVNTLTDDMEMEAPEESEPGQSHAFAPPEVVLTQECDGVRFHFEIVPKNMDRYRDDLFCVAKDALIVSINILESEISQAALAALESVDVYIIDTNRYDFGAVGLTRPGEGIAIDAWVFDELWYESRASNPDYSDDRITSRVATAFFGLVVHEMIHLVEIELGEADIDCPHCSDRWLGDHTSLEGTARRTAGVSVFNYPNVGLTE